MEVTALYLANGAVRRVVGRSEEVGAALRIRRGGDDGLRHFAAEGGGTITVNLAGVLMAEPVTENATRKVAFGFSRVLNEEA